LKVVGSTMINTPSEHFKEVPYYVLLLRDEKGYFSAKRSFENKLIGEEYSSGEKKSRDYSIGVIGTGVSGKGLVQACLSHDFRVVWKTRNKDTANLEWARIKNQLNRGFSSDEITEMKKKLIITDDFSNLSSCDLVIEAVVENLEVKRQVLEQIESFHDGVIVSNTSSISINKLSQRMRRPELFAGMHFFTPIHKMKLVELICGKETAHETLLVLVDISKRLGKNPITLNDSPGFVVNRVMIPYLQESVILLEKGISDKANIDTAVKLGLNFPMGPFELIDLIGLDIFKEIVESLYLETKEEKFLVRPLIMQMIKDNKLGRKTGVGFYKYK